MDATKQFDSFVSERKQQQQRKMSSALKIFVFLNIGEWIFSFVCLFFRFFSLVFFFYLKLFCVALWRYTQRYFRSTMIYALRTTHDTMKNVFVVFIFWDKVSVVADDVNCNYRNLRYSQLGLISWLFFLFKKNCHFTHTHSPVCLCQLTWAATAAVVVEQCKQQQRRLSTNSALSF